MCKGRADVVVCSASLGNCKCSIMHAERMRDVLLSLAYVLSPLASRHLGSALALRRMLLSEYCWMRFAPLALSRIRSARVHVSPSCICSMISLCCVLSLSSGLSYAHFSPIRSYIHLGPRHFLRTSPPRSSNASAPPLSVPPVPFYVSFPAPIMCLIQRQQQQSLDLDYSRLRIISSCPPSSSEPGPCRCPAYCTTTSLHLINVAVSHAHITHAMYVFHCIVLFTAMVLK